MTIIHILVTGINILMTRTHVLMTRISILTIRMKHSYNKSVFIHRGYHAEAATARKHVLVARERELRSACCLDFKSSAPNCEYDARYVIQLTRTWKIICTKLRVWYFIAHMYIADSKNAHFTKTKPEESSHNTIARTEDRLKLKIGGPVTRGGIPKISRQSPTDSGRFPRASFFLIQTRVMNN